MAGYGDDVGLAAWLTANGYTLLASAPAPAVLRQRGSAYIDGLYGTRFAGIPTGGLAQERAWPRAGAATYYGLTPGPSIPDNVIPAAVIEASYVAAYQDASKPGSLSAAASGGKQLKRIKTGSTEIEYAAGEGSAAENATPVLTAVEGLLAPYLIAELPATAVGLWSIGCG